MKAASTCYRQERNAKGRQTAQVKYLKFALNELLAVLLQQFKQLTVLDASHLQNLSRSITKMSVIAGLQESLVNEDSQRWAVGTHLIFAAMEVDRCLDTNGGINSSHDCGGNLDEWGVASVQVGCQTSNIKTDTTTNGNDRFLAPAQTMTAG